MKVFSTASFSGPFDFLCHPLPPPQLDVVSLQPLLDKDHAHSSEALEGAIRLANSFSYSHPSTYILSNSSFLRLPDTLAILEQVYELIVLTLQALLSLPFRNGSLMVPLASSAGVCLTSRVFHRLLSTF